MIGCDGAHSAVRHGLGMEFEGDDIVIDWILADLHLAAYHDRRTRSTIYLACGWRAGAVSYYHADDIA